MKRITFIGLGVMGGGIAGTLLQAGYDLTVWSRNPDHNKPFVKRGAKAASTIAAAVKDAEVVWYCLSDDAAIEDVVFGHEGVLSSVTRGQIVLDSSTVHPETSRRQAAAYVEKGVEFLDIPVFGSRSEAASGALWVLAGGKRDVFDRVRPLLDAISESVHYMGGPGKGRALGCGEVKFTGQVLPTAKKVTYRIDLKRVILRKLVMGIGDAIMEVDGKPIYEASDLRVGLFTSTQDF